MLVLEHSGMTDPGKVRRNNEDSLLVGEGRDETLFVVADGIGGFEAGEVASSIAVDVLKDLVPSASLEEAIREANRRILAAARGDEKLSGMGTTVVAMRFGEGRPGEATGGEPAAEISHVGDSRAYLLRGGDLLPVTEDHSLVAELVRSGDLTRAQASEHPQKNLITRALGADEEVEVDTAVIPVEPDDRLVLCSDGLSDMVSEVKMHKLLTASPENPDETARALVKAALDAGGLDNVTVVVVDVREEEDPPAQEPRRGGTREMRIVSSEEAGARRRQRLREERQRGPRALARPLTERAARREAARKRRRSFGQRFGAFIRALAVVLVVAALVTPFYLWGASRYFLGFDGDEVVVYRGLPYAPLGLSLNEEVQRTGLMQSDIQPRYRDEIEDNTLYSSEEQAEAIVRDLEAG